ncbi:LNS2-domain-containing protein [Gymnopus androsaceus JB14]|uniref:phosphatidate phosphatase n=1 Tax=Gymnopus androsaceus JB14 TaxID=1447944 RepID=A0A6A4IH18_9AGAR|nr:LNS2-domain-containing protein [Gymnopus androsaceus JB14]
MNYIRGAVNAISAPYQYYKDINPATLTGAIDVIVIQRPSDNGGSELACSPFHVRFGKWQVLRPGEKKVTVSVNGHPIPFDMKIGEAGEAFFIFETEDDVPEDLITSPLLRPSSPEATETDVDKKNGDEIPTDELEPLDLNALPSPPDEEDTQILSTPTHRTSASASNIMDASGSSDRLPTRRRSSTLSVSTPNVSSLPSPPPSPTRTKAEKEQDERADAAIKQTVGEVHVPEIKYQDGIALDTEGYHSQQPKSKKSKKKSSVHDRQRSDRTIRGYDGDGTNSYTFPGDKSFDAPYLTHTRSQPPPESESDSDSDDDDDPHSDSDDTDDGLDLNKQHRNSQSLTVPFPTRATSEPPPNLPPSSTSAFPPASPGPSTSKRFTSPGKLTVLTPVQEYSWEWGAFPQPSPMKTSFGKGGRLEGGHGVSGLGSAGDDDYNFPSPDSRHGRMPATWGRTGGSARKGKSIGLSTVDSDDEGENTRSRSVPPRMEDSPTRERKVQPLTRGAVCRTANMDDAEGGGSGTFGAGGKLSVSKAVVELEDDGKNRNGEYANGDADEELSRGRQARDSNSSRPSAFRVYSPDGRWQGIDEFETARMFEKGKISFKDFIQDDHLVQDPRLVIRWTRQQYISQRDSSPLMNALGIWRYSYIKRKGKRASTRPVSPVSALSEEEQEEDIYVNDPLSDSESKKITMERSKSEPPQETKELSSSAGLKSPPPTSSSWVQWWRRSRRNDVSATTDSMGTRPELKETFSAPSVGAIQSLEAPTPPAASRQGSAPALPSTPVQRPLNEREITPKAHSPPGSPKKYAKTLRLTSDQLKSLNLKPGPNSITFSHSMSGAVACTARIFMWDSTDLVVISDIDGTITKSDGLGHVFAMIGRDWTHLGVAKLYTDICRNGYKVLYLTSRAIGQADATRGYLKGIKQNDYQLPEGPVIMSPDRLMASLHREVIMRKPEVFKMACLRDIQRLFGEASRNPFYAGFGNRITDALSYRSVNVPSSRIFTIDSAGEVKCELLELAGYKSSYIHMTDLVDQMFPPIHRKWAPEFTDFNFWKPPMQEFPLPDFSPPSPALSARSDNSSSTFARLRNFSLVGTRQTNIPRANTMKNSVSSHASDSEHHPLRNATLQQMSSFERLSNTLGFSGNTSKDDRRSESPDSRSYSSSSYAGSEDEDEGWAANSRRRERTRSITSMPGSLEDMNLGVEEDEEGEIEYVHDQPEEYSGEYDPDGEEDVE